MPYKQSMGAGCQLAVAKVSKEGLFQENEDRTLCSGEFLAN
ncbi:hypothetical protein Lpp22_0828 [Lacticaseibacillus paracasei subsp. paracasei Lpp22]|jgi:hypothetical protein|uniref:Uncharacterized protein n=1 Tax=Lacticaseibacillus paracasei subsp. paracasei Lpp22 TaxID=1256221 RepID=A0A8E0IBW3_LACPA|nr:hypothetical protein Lpp22_0828 [Lacticaseibacillus paracasei subsp. paracasei Lpp22]